MNTRWALLLLSSTLLGCPGEEVECVAATDCGGAEAPCAGCPEVPEALCRENVCEVRGDDATTIVANVNIRPRSLDVASLVHVVADMTSASGPLTCDNAFDGERLSADVNVLAAGYKALSGGSYHPDVTVGRVPQQRVAVLLIGTDQNAGEGAVLAHGCETDLEATGETFTVDLIDLEGL